MTRRKNIQTLAAIGAAGAAVPAAAAGSAIQLHVDLEVNPAKEADLAATYQKVFQPAIRKQPGFVDVKLLKFREAKSGKGPGVFRYRLLISFQTEDQRVKWVASAEHQKVWPQMEACLTGTKYTATLYDLV